MSSRKAKTVVATVKLEVDPRRAKLVAAQTVHAAATAQFDAALDALAKARTARDKAAADLLAAQEACVTP